MILKSVLLTHTLEGLSDKCSWCLSDADYVKCGTRGAGDANIQVCKLHFTSTH